MTGVAGEDMMHDVAVVRYERPLESLRRAVELAGGMRGVSGSSRVAIKPNFCLWREGVDWPKYGVLTTARLVEDMVVLLKERGVERITMLEGIVENEKRAVSTLQLVAKGMGLDILARRYGVNIVDVLKERFTKVEMDGETMSVNADILEADYVVNIPVLKTHSQTVVSLGIKNLKGTLSIPSRKRCHSVDPGNDLNRHLARLPGVVWPSLTVIDGIYSLERGPLLTGRAYRSDMIIASTDVVSADKVAATMLGIEPRTVPHLTLAAETYERPADLSDVTVVGEVDITTALKRHEWEFEQNEAGDLPLFFERAGVRGLTYPQADTTMCTYCADFIYYVIQGILMAENRDEPLDDVEVLHGKMVDPSGAHRHTLLVGQCQVKRNGDNPLIRHCVRIKGCPPSRADLVRAYAELGIELPKDFLKRMERNPADFLKRYADDPDFDEALFRVQ
jgi:uncharacterized protein (DUF362 family)